MAGRRPPMRSRPPAPDQPAGRGTRRLHGFSASVDPLQGGLSGLCASMHEFIGFATRHRDSARPWISSDNEDPNGRPPMQTLDFELDGDYIELNQLLKLAGVVDSGA